MCARFSWRRRRCTPASRCSWTGSALRQAPPPPPPGAFGSHIDVKYATILGMLPDCDLSHVRSAGNAAGTGARIALLDANSRGVIEDLVRRIEKVETAIEPRFQQLFVEAMAIPHKPATYTHLRKVVDLPPPKESTSQSKTRGRRPRRTEPPRAV